MGYQIGVTPLQMATAVSSIANGGRLMRPRLVRAFWNGTTRKAVAPEVIRRTVTPETAATLTTIMEGVVDRGTAKAAQIEASRSPQRPAPPPSWTTACYSNQKYNVVDRRVLPVTQAGRDGAGRHGLAARRRLLRRRRGGAGVQAHRGSGHPAPRRAAQLNPEPPVMVRRATRNPAVTPSRSARSAVLPAVTTPSRDGIMPDLRGMSARDGVHTLVRAGFMPRMHGHGVVTAQGPMAGTALDPGMSVRLWLDRARRPPPRTRRPSHDRRRAADALLQPALLPALPAVSDAVGSTAAAGVVYDSRRAVPGAVFVAVRGEHATARVCAAGRRARGRVVVVAEAPPRDATRRAWVQVPDARLALALLADRYFAHPSGDLRVVGITGTNGKTTTAYLLARDVRSRGASLRADRHGGLQPGREEREATRTTPEAPDMQRCCARWWTGRAAAVMEVSSHALALQAVDGMQFAAGCVHEPDARPPRFPRRHGDLRRRQAPAVRDTPGRCAGDRERRRSARRRCSSTPRGGR